MSAQVLDNPLDFPLHGSRLIEASAGTGKTYTIAALYVRLVLQHGAEGMCFNRELMPKEILVMTFTRAATAELADRIRSRLSEAATYFRSTAQTSGDKFLDDLRNDYAQQGCNDAELTRLARRLELAAESMDESAVYTINGWCQKMLTEHAFASGSLFEQEVQTEEDELKLAATEDYFRCFVYSLEPDFAREVLSILESPEKLVKKIGRAPEGVAIATAGYASIVGAREQAQQQAQDEVQVLKDKYREALDVLDSILALPDKNNGGRKNAAQAVMQWLGSDDVAIASVGKSDDLTVPKLTKKFGDKLPDSAAVFADYLADFAHADGIAKRADSGLLQHASGYIHARFQELKQQAAIMGFDDMLTRLRDALRGPNGDHLAQTIREQFPVALVDEFQDTDPVQYEIFDTVYQVEKNQATTGIFLIGDPKQAIYSFRNADIFTYLKARKATEGRHYNLARNFRSSQKMVDAVNQLFRIAEDSTEKGAFLYKQEIPFVEVGANGQKKVFKGLEGKEEAALHWHIGAEPAGKKDDYQRPSASYHANLIAQLLMSDKAGFYEEGERTPVLSKDIAVLVANANEARLIRGELAKRGIRSVYLSESDSVYSQPVAADLLALVQACAQPRDPSRVRTALATPLLGEPLTRLVEYQENELAWEAAVERFIGYHELWDKFGVLAALQRLLHDNDVPARLLADAREGERQLADTLHICELLQQESMKLDGIASLEEYFALQVQEYKSSGGYDATSKRTNSEALQLRLESDEDLVKVITYHKSKGLQYPLVFMPFAAYTGELRHRFKEYKFPLSYHEVNSKGERVKRVAWNNGDKAAMKWILEETLAEDIRKMYVALTRAEFATFVTLQALGDPQHNPLFYLLYGDDPATNKQTDVVDKARDVWQTADIEHTRVSLIRHDAAKQVPPSQHQSDALAALTFTGNFRQRAWWVTSYSALSYGSEIRTPDTAREMNTIEGARDVQQESPERPESTYTNEQKEQEINKAEGRIHHLPKGAGPGTFLHNLLEDAAEHGFAEVAANANVRDAILEKRCKSPLWQDYREHLEHWLQAYVQVKFELPARPFALADLSVFKAEPEFWFETRNVSTVRIDDLIAKHIQAEYERPRLDSSTLNGMLKGFIDLVFEYEGKYYVADYKSNWLGEHDHDYSLVNMRKKILASRYDLQYVIYTLALHKLLKARLGDTYDYDTHVGGAVYLFLRGHHADTRGAFFDRPPRVLIEALENEFLAQGVAHV